MNSRSCRRGPDPPTVQEGVSEREGDGEVELRLLVVVVEGWLAELLVGAEVPVSGSVGGAVGSSEVLSPEEVLGKGLCVALATVSAFCLLGAGGPRITPATKALTPMRREMITMDRWFTGLARPKSLMIPG